MKHTTTPFGPRTGAGRRTTARRVVAASLTLGCLSLTACGGDDPKVLANDDGPVATDAPVDTKAPSTTEPPVVLPTTNPPGTDAPTTTAPAAGGIEVVEASTIQIVAKGTFVDPDFGAYEKAGTGSGFVIDESGLAVTNNHVVAGAGLIEVYVAGEDRPRNAKVVGVSECSDLAVIDIDGAAIPALDWYQGDIAPGLEVYAAGFPLSDPEYTLTRGIVSKAEVTGESSWASVDHVIEHDAATQPGNSGGPLVSADGQVVGINYATWNRTNTTQFHAIQSQDARSIIDTLASGKDVDSLGINGKTVSNEDGSLVGVWVSAVVSGSPADESGILPGDIITRLEGVTVGGDGTMSDYCDVMRTHQPGDVLSVEVVRYSTMEVLHGQFNGDYLIPSFSFADQFEDTSADGADYTDYVSITDDSGQLTVTVPTAWADIDGAAIDLGGVSSPSIIASTSVAEYNSRWDVPGVQFVASEALLAYDADELLDLATSAECTSTGRETYEDGHFIGRFEVFANCGGTGATSIIIAAFPTDGAYGVLVAVQVVTDADLVALDEVLRTFDVTV